MPTAVHSRPFLEGFHERPAESGAASIVDYEQFERLPHELVRMVTSPIHAIQVSNESRVLFPY
jgi:hypothetical protein